MRTLLSRFPCRRVLLALVLLASSVGRPARVGARESAAPTARALGHPQQKGVTTPPAISWGWLVIAPSLVAGTACLTYGLSQDCSEADTSCQRRASLAIWGSVGIISLGSLIGISLSSSGAASTQAKAKATSLDLSLELTRPARSAGLAPPGGAMLWLTGPLR
jgi:hypothetical protein